ncbi:MAG: M20/M25/M40 family metallo-hydrolase, partial [Planctomycetales bacterium]|nr:M20/M25/M40 family metallo-hydrolase [Planctomycetales bacterium]
MKELLKSLIASAPTAQNGEHMAALVLSNYFKQHGLPVRVDCWDTCRANVVVSIGPDNPEIPALVIGAHLDVVPATKEHWTTDPFVPVEKDGKIYGRGAVDMLGGLCAAADAICQLHAEKVPLKGRVILAATAGEETDSCGAKRFVEQMQSALGRVAGILIPEPTGLKIMRAHRGILWLKIETLGKTAHGSMPQLGINAIKKMNALLNRLEQWKL